MIIIVFYKIYNVSCIFILTDMFLDIKGFKLLLIFILEANLYTANKVTIFGATGGLGQWCSKLLIDKGYLVTAVTRDVKNAQNFELLKGSKIFQADAKVLDSSLISSVKNSDVIIISVGTTAFPTEKWKNGNDPRSACVDTVSNILGAVEKSRNRPSKMILLSSIGLERRESFPFKILNLYGILDAKRESELLFLDKASKLGSKAIVSRPGRLVGAPFTNNDLAKLFQINQGENQGIVLNNQDILSGDIERKDVAESIKRIIESKRLPDKLTYSIINKKGPPPDDLEWNQLLKNLF